MDCEIFDSGSVICGNFAELLPEKPKDFDYMRTAKWLEDYPFDVRDVIGGTVCNCIKVEVHFAPYYGFTHYHQSTCFIMQKYRNTVNAEYFWSMQNLPAISFGDKAVPADAPKRMYIQGRSSSKKIAVRRSVISANQLSLV